MKISWVDNEDILR